MLPPDKDFDPKHTASIQGDLLVSVWDIVPDEVYFYLAVSSSSYKKLEREGTSRLKGHYGILILFPYITERVPRIARHPSTGKFAKNFYVYNDLNLNALLHAVPEYKERVLEIFEADEMPDPIYNLPKWYAKKFFGSVAAYKAFQRLHLTKIASGAYDPDDEVNN